MNCCALTGTIAEEPIPFTAKGFGGKTAYKFVITVRDEMRPAYPMRVSVVVSPVIAKPVEDMVAKGRKFAGVTARFEGTLTQGRFVDPKSGEPIPTVNVYAKSYEIFAFDDATAPRVSKSYDGSDTFDLAAMRRKEKAKNG